MIIVVFALPDESLEFRRAIGARRKAGGGWRGDLAGSPIVVTHCGVGPAAAARAAARLLAGPRPEFVVIAGFAGALVEDLAIADLVVATNFSTAALAERAQRCGLPARAGRLVSVPLPADTVAEKQALAATGAIAVDMETEAFAAALTRAAVPLLALRTISDRAAEPLPVPFAEWFDLARQRPRVASLLRFLARHPTRIPAFFRFVRGLGPARRALSRFLVAALSGPAGLAAPRGPG